jgi:hypothetical protein
MANYKDIHGTNIETVTSDPSNPVNGQVWYNSTDQVLKGFTSNPAGAWATGGNMNTGRYYGSSSGTSSSSALYAGGSSPIVANTELYGGTSWTEVADLNQARHIFSATGTQTSTVAFGGHPGRANTEQWNGSGWTEVADLNTGRAQLGSAGASNTSALAFGGASPPSTSYAQTESWNGSSWTETTDLNTGRGFVFGGPIGVQTDALCGSGYIYGGPSPGGSQNTELWNGSTWTELSDSPSDAGGGARFGTTSSALYQNGTNVFIWNGTAWSTATSNSNNLTSRQGAGTTSSGLIAGGEPPSSGAATTEEWAAPATSTVTFTVS